MDSEEKPVRENSFVVVGVKTSITEFNRGYQSIIRSPSQSNISDDDLELPYVTAAKFAASLEDAILRLKILDEKNLEQEQLFTQEVSDKKLTCRQLTLKLRLQRNAHKSASYASEEARVKLIDDIGDSGLLSAINIRYIANWKSAVTEQHLQIIHETEDKHMSSIRQYKDRQDKEIRAHDEVERFNSVVIAETLEKVEEIMDRHAREIEVFDFKIQLGMSRLAAKVAERREMEQKLASRQEAIDNWCKYTKARAERQASVNKRNNAAVTVQAWWRGLLVRKQLGPYRQNKQKAGAAKKTKSSANQTAKD
ncbi:hypothetical protein O0L34_g9413 [Tuta absoluta]|nr:hypothetical protein O0L34_g9413 [Tuta absoluta]